MNTSDQCLCGHPVSAHRPSAPPPSWGRVEPVIVVRRGECQARWTERGGRDRVHCECPRFAPEDDDE